MSDFPAGTISWARDPTGAHDERPVIILSHEKHPFSATDCAVMCAGTSAKQYDHSTPVLREEHVERVSFSEPTYLMPWALYTIPPGVIRAGEPAGKLTERGTKLVKKELIRLLMN